MALGPVQRLARFQLNARAPDALARFFTEALGFARDGAADGLAGLSLGASRLEIAAATGAAYPAEVPGWSLLFQHFAIAVADMAGAMRRLEAVPGWTPISRGGPQRLPAASGGVTAFKFRDPEGHPLELLAWPDAGAAPIPRIDHSAISVADTAASAAFYQALGLEVGSRSLNVGPEQARLDGLDGAEVEVTALIPPHPVPHVELLCYRGDYRRAKAVADPDDVAATRMVLTTALAGLDAIAADLPAHIVDLASAAPTPRASLLLRDPDGHLLQIEAAP